MTDGERIMELIRQREAKLLASTSLMMELQNPFQRPAVSATDIAWRLGWTTAATTRSGRERQDTPRAKKELLRLCAAGELIEAGHFRTLHAGSKNLLCYCTPGFMALRQRRIDELAGYAPLPNSAIAP